jgi:divalent metal cation (Fe/Co/Zn/Cd) transporter
MDKAMDEKTKELVYEIVKEHKEIIKTNHFNSTPVGYKYQISLTIFVDGNLSTFESHDIANRLEKEIIKRVDSIYLAVIHVNPMDVKKTKK